MSKPTISEGIAVVTVRPPAFYSLELKPPTEAIRKAAAVLGSLGGNNNPPVLLGDPMEALQRSSRIKAALLGEKPPESKPDKLLPDFFQWLLFSGIIIRTDDAYARHVLDRVRSHDLSRHIPTPLQTSEARDMRLRELLNLPPRTGEKKSEPPPGIIEASEVRGAVVAAARARFNGLMDTYPELGDLAFTLGLLAAHSAKGRADGINETTDNIGRLILSLRDRIDSDAMSVIEDLTGKQASDAPTGKKSFDPRAEIHALQLARKPIDAAYQRLSQQKTLADGRLDHLSLEVIDQDLRQKLRFATTVDKPKIEAAIVRAESVAKTLEEYIDNLGAIMKPLKDLIDQIQKRIVALTILTMPEPVTAFELAALPVMPEFDEDQLLDWRNMTLPTTPDEATFAAAEEMEAVVEAISDDASALAPTDVATELGLILPSGRMNEEFIAAIFQVVGRRSAVRIMTALRDIGLITNQAQKNWIFSVCIKMAAEGSATPFLKFCGNMAGLAIYKTADSLSPDLADRLLPRALQERLREMLKAKPKK